MKLTDLKEGQKITHWVCGELVEAEVIQRDGKGVCTRHKPIIWGNQIFRETWVNPSTSAQVRSHAPTTPAAFYNGQPITI
jgi:hypothetical protein